MAEIVEFADAATKSEQIAHSLGEMILSGELPPGTVLRQEEVSRRFQVSRTPVREALRELVALGMATFEPNRGVRVRGLDRDELRQGALARAALEGVLAELAVQNITDEELRQLDEARLEFERLTAELLADPEANEQLAVEWGAANTRFHEIISAAAAAPLIEQMIPTSVRTFSGHTRWHTSDAARRFYEADVRGHAALAAAIVAKCPEAARVLASAHVLDTWHLLQDVLDEASASGGSGSGS